MRTMKHITVLSFVFLLTVPAALQARGVLLSPEDLDPTVRDALRAEIDALLAGLDDAEEDRVVALVKMVEKMRAKDAAPIVSELDPEVAVSVIDRMSSTKAGKMLAAMEPVTAAGLAARSAARPAVP